MDTKRWKVMLAVDDYGSFTRAGEVLGYTQSGITQMMKSLEREVGFPLFVKDSHGMRLTREAQALLPTSALFSQRTRWCARRSPLSKAPRWAPSASALT